MMTITNLNGQTGKPLNLKIGRFDAVYQNGNLKLK